MMQVYLCDGVRTAFGRFGGALSSLRPDDMAAEVIQALLKRNAGLSASAVEEIVLGCANQAGEDNRNIARMAGLLAGMPVTTPGTTVNRLCASGADAIGVAARAIAAGEIDIAIAGGIESMSRAPFVIGKAERAWSRAAFVEDTTIGWRFVNAAMQRLYGTDTMPETAENVAEDYSVTRDAQDRFALSSQMRTAAATKTGYFADEIANITVSSPSGVRVVAADEHPRPETSFETLSGLRPVVRPGGTVTAGNASGINDGAAVTLLASKRALKRFQLVPRGRILGFATAGVAPRVMGIGPVPATEKLLARLGLSLKDFDLIEINEAFASQVIVSLRMLGADPFADYVNPHGGAIAIGHPLGASGARLAITALRGLEVLGGKRALVTMCVGVGQGLSLAIEKV